MGLEKAFREDQRRVHGSARLQIWLIPRGCGEGGREVQRGRGGVRGGGRGGQPLCNTKTLVQLIGQP